MSNVFFVAVQCCQCSTMQVKQRNKKSARSSNNKWTCVVCNQKQSVRKVFAQGPMAKHLRSFVQSFNMSRQSQQRFTIDDEDEDEDDRNSQTTKKPRTDWSDYLDRPYDDSHTSNNIDEEENDVGDFGPKIMTDLPMEFLNKQAVPKVEDKTSKEASKWSDYASGNEVPRVRKRTLGDDDKEASKWSDYVSEDGNEVPRVSTRTFGDDDAAPWNDAALQTITDDQTVEDVVHPDFL